MVRMKQLFSCAAVAFSISALSIGTAASAELSPVGDWLVKDGYAHIRIDNCSGKMWGVVAWEKESGVDNNNPDPAKRNRPMLGVPILLGLKPVQANKWEGEIYNSQNGKIYQANITMLSPDVLKLEGCVFGGLFCGGENWTRVANPTGNIGSSPTPPAGQTKAGQPKAAAKGNPPPLSDVCQRVAAETGQLPAPPAAAKGASK